MSIPKVAYMALESIVGPEWISDDPAIRMADTKGGYGTGVLDVDAKMPGCSIQPGSSKEVQRIVNIANRYKIPYIPTASFFTTMCAPSVDDAVMIDLKRMNKLEIHEKNLYAVVEPGISFSMLQVELLKRGLFTFTPGSGAQSSVLANHVHCGDAALGWRLGEGYRRILATEWVLPNGEFLKLGSRSYLKDYFWGEGPGPDLRALLRGNEGHEGGMGVVTTMAVKIFPFIPERLIPEGRGPNSTLSLPENRFKWYNITFPSIERSVDAIYELGRCEIALIVMTVPLIFREIARYRGKGANTFWERWKGLGKSLDRNKSSLRVLLFGWTSEKQLAYEEKVLTDVVAEYGGTAIIGKPTDESHFMSADSVSVWFVGGRFFSQVYLDSLDSGLKTGKVALEIAKRRTPPLVESWDSPGWFVGDDFAHLGKEETLNYCDIESQDALLAHEQNCRENDLRIGSYPMMEDCDMFGEAWYNYNVKMRELKRIFDPNNLSNPPKPINRPNLSIGSIRSNLNR